MTPALRIIDSPLGPVVPVNDIAEMIGYTRQALSGLIRSKPGDIVAFYLVSHAPDRWRQPGDAMHHP